MPKFWWTLDELASRSGQHLGCSEWHQITQQHIDDFAESTGDRQWVHTVPQYAEASPYRKTIAHGFLLLSLIPALYDELFKLTDVEMALNFRVDSLRFRAPVLVDTEIRGSFDLVSVRQRPKGWTGAVLRTNVELRTEDGSTPACTLEQTWLYQRAARVYTIDELMPSGWPVTAMPRASPGSRPCGQCLRAPSST